MHTQEELESHPLFPLFSASFDNHDVAFALDIPSFSDWRKSLDRGKNLTLPRADENPVRPRYRLGHVYEFALIKELTKSLTKEVAALVIRDRLTEMSSRARGAIGRWGALSVELQEVVNSNGTVSALENVDSEEKLRWFHFSYLVDFPWLGFDPEILDRSPEAMANPVMWVIAPDVAPDATLSTYKVVKTFGNDTFMDALALLTKTLKSLSDFPEMVPEYRSAIPVNVTGLFADVEAKLTIRLRGRRLKGNAD